jgi:hypothetical protein
MSDMGRCGKPLNSGSSAVSSVTAATLVLACLTYWPSGAAAQSVNTGADLPSPLTVSISAPISSNRDLPSIEFHASDVPRANNAVLNSARVVASVDGADYVPVGVFQPGTGRGGRIDTVLPRLAIEPGFHVVQLAAELRFRPRQIDAPSWTEQRALQPLAYALYDPVAQDSAAIRELVYGPRSVPVHELDPALGDEPFAAWLSGVLSERRTAGDSGPQWTSRYCDQRTENGPISLPTTICAVVYFRSCTAPGEIWFRTAEIRETDRGVEWVPAVPLRFEGLVVDHSVESHALSSLITLLDTAAESRPVGELAILPEDILIAPPAPKAGALTDVTVTIRNIGLADFFKAAVDVTVGTDPTRSTVRQFVVDIPARESIALKLQVLFATGYGFIMVHGRPSSERTPSSSISDPKHNACALRVVNARLAPARYGQTLLEMAGGCTAN